MFTKHMDFTNLQSLLLKQNTEDGAFHLFINIS